MRKQHLLPIVYFLFVGLQAIQMPSLGFSASNSHKTQLK
jgi:hypothetical protein